MSTADVHGWHEVDGIVRIYSDDGQQITGIMTIAPIPQHPCMCNRIPRCQNEATQEDMLCTQCREVHRD